MVLLALGGLELRRQSMRHVCGTTNLHKHSIYYSIFEPSANREWVQGSKTQQSYSSGEWALQFTPHFIGSVHVLIVTS
jgi:hypothetical protein